MSAIEFSVSGRVSFGCDSSAGADRTMLTIRNGDVIVASGELPGLTVRLNGTPRLEFFRDKTLHVEEAKQWGIKGHVELNGGEYPYRAPWAEIEGCES